MFKNADLVLTIQISCETAQIPAAHFCQSGLEKNSFINSKTRPPVFDRIEE